MVQGILETGFWREIISNEEFCIPPYLQNHNPREDQKPAFLNKLSQVILVHPAVWKSFLYQPSTSGKLSSTLSHFKYCTYLITHTAIAQKVQDDCKGECGPLGLSESGLELACGVSRVPCDLVFAKQIFWAQLEILGKFPRTDALYSRVVLLLEQLSVLWSF